MTEYFDKEMEKLEVEQRKLRDIQDERDRYSTLQDNKFAIQDFKDVVNSKLDYAPKDGVKWLDYVTELKIHAKLAAEKNWKTHVDNPYKVWHTHVLPLGCFMCSDTEMISLLVRVIALMASQYPDNRF